jgi:undecaprenyl-phosphate 4-deoxy-4-formamido-L-arabinose transferase
MSAEPQTIPELSVCIPVYNESGNLALLHQRLTDTLAAYGKTYELVFVDDGSTDGSLEILTDLSAKDPHIRILRFFRNFGQQMAVLAAFHDARGESVVLIDADLQTHPEDIPPLVDELLKGYDIVYGQRKHRKDPWYRTVTSRCMSMMLNKVTGIRVPDSSSGFIALSRVFLDTVNLYNEKTKFHAPLLAWLSYGRWSTVPVSHDARHSGTSKYNFYRLASLAVTFVCNYSAFPLHLAGFLGILFACLGAAGLLMSFVWGVFAGGAGVPAILSGIAFFSGIQLFFTSVLGEYTVRIFNEVKDRPPYVVREVIEGGQVRQG